MVRRSPPQRKQAVFLARSGQLVDIGPAFANHDPGEKAGHDFVTRPSRNRSWQQLFAADYLNCLGGRRANGGSAYIG